MANLLEMLWQFTFMVCYSVTTREENWRSQCQGARESSSNRALIFNLIFVSTTAVVSEAHQVTLLYSKHSKHYACSDNSLSWCAIMTTTTFIRFW